MPAKLNVIPDALSRLLGEIESEALPYSSAMASICRNVPSEHPYHPPGPRDNEISVESLNDVDIVQDNNELFGSVVSFFQS